MYFPDEFPVPVDEDDRQRVLESYGILDTPADEAFDRISRLAGRIFDVPIVLVSLIDRERQFIKSCFGIQLSETPRDVAFCSYTILKPEEVMVVEDASKNERFASNPLVTGKPNIRFYAGVPLLAQERSALGSFCLIDRKPRSIGREELETLKDLARLVEGQIQLHERRQAAQVSAKEYKALHERVSESLDELRKNLTHIIPHELRTPLNGVVGFSQLLRENWGRLRESEIERMLLGLYESGERLERSVGRLCMLNSFQLMEPGDEEALMALTRDGGGSSVLQELANFVSESVSERYRRAGDLSLDMEAGISELPRLYFLTLLEELLDNAFKFSERGEEVRVVGRRRWDGGYQIKVLDLGCGMSRKEIALVGEFMQYGRSQTEQQGWGLGLALVGKIAEAFDLSWEICRRGDGADGMEAVVRFPPSSLHEALADGRMR